MNVYEIEPPDAEGAARIAPVDLPRDPQLARLGHASSPRRRPRRRSSKLASLPPREMRRAIQAAFGNAKLAGRSEVGPDDIQDGRAGEKPADRVLEISQ